MGLTIVSEYLSGFKYSVGQCIRYGGHIFTVHTLKHGANIYRYYILKNKKGELVDYDAKMVEEHGTIHLTTLFKRL